jgi:hypothetical protein
MYRHYTVVSTGIDTRFPDVEKMILEIIGDYE